MEVNLLPFLKNKEKSISGLIIKTRNPDEPKQEEPQDESVLAIEACADDLIKAVHAKDVKAAAQAMKDAFDILESLPHEEVEHDYDHQNELAAKEAGE